MFIDESYIERVPLNKVPRGQVRVAGLLKFMYRWPEKTEIVLEGLDNLPADRSVILALNHTDRYNYWPLQYELHHRQCSRYTVAWVKAKYYQNKILAQFFDQCNNLPLPSRGYLILKDAQETLGRRLEKDEYRLLRELCDLKIERSSETQKIEKGIATIFEKARRDFSPSNETYACFMNRWCDRVMALVERRSLESLYECEKHLLVFPQGTRSTRLLSAKTGVLQFALKHEIPVVPVGSNGCDNIYPGASPWPSGGRVVYRIGKMLTQNDTFKGYSLPKTFRPFTNDAQAHEDTLVRAGGVLTAAIDELLDPAYKMDRSSVDSDSHYARLL
ncbi:MAG: 1-acyl-sn-glycerol-3-phosphate acyltransferase [Myxococcota bacterium]|nr:1-acyl-sn-glycerol-3-phosphate acyltransferase [Myxococcota bacterium]